MECLQWWYPFCISAGVAVRAQLGQGHQRKIVQKLCTYTIQVRHQKQHRNRVAVSWICCTEKYLHYQQTLSLVPAHVPCPYSAYPLCTDAGRGYSSNRGWSMKIMSQKGNWKSLIFTRLEKSFQWIKIEKNQKSNFKIKFCDQMFQAIKNA